MALYMDSLTSWHESRKTSLRERRSVSSGSLTEIANHNKDLFIYLFILNIIDRITSAQFQFNTMQTQFKLMQSFVICWYPLL